MSIKDKIINGELEQLFKNTIKKRFYDNIFGRRFKRVSRSEKLINIYCDLFKNFKGLNVLDIGCFSGLFSILISDFANYVVGVDKAEGPITFANEIKNKLKIPNIDFVNKYIGDFIRDCDYVSLNINSLFIHKAMGQMVEKEISAIRSIAPYMKIIITTGKQLNDINCFEIMKSSNKYGLYILKNKVSS